MEDDWVSATLKFTLIAFHVCSSFVCPKSQLVLKNVFIHYSSLFFSTAATTSDTTPMLPFDLVLELSQIISN